MARSRGLGDVYKRQGIMDVGGPIIIIMDSMGVIQILDIIAILFPHVLVWWVDQSFLIHDQGLIIVCYVRQ
jgi:hypothetical protein